MPPHAPSRPHPARAILLAAACLAAAATPIPAQAQRFEPLPPEQAFNFTARMQDNHVIVEYQMPPGIYLYQKNLLLTTAPPTPAAIQIAAPPLPKATLKNDPFFGESRVYYHGLTLRAAVRGTGDFTLLAQSLGCDEQTGICYPPQQNTAHLTAAELPLSENPAYTRDEAGYLSQSIAANSLLGTLALFFILGIGLSFTPCVLPMLPILLGVIGGGAKTRRRIVALTAAYIAGVTLAFTLLGILAALGGKLLSAALQTPWALAGTAFLFCLLALSLLGAYELQPPAALRRRLTAPGNGGGGGNAGGAFLMGVISAIVVSPCVAAPLVAALIYIGAGGDIATGAAALFALAMGMSVLLAIAGIAGASILPRAGAWTVTVKHLFGIGLLALATWIATPLLPATVPLLLYGALLIFTSTLLWQATQNIPSPQTTPLPPLLRTLAAATALWGAAMLAGAAGGGEDALTPLSPYTGAANTATPANATAFQPINSLPQLQTALETSDRPVLLDFYADWCISCKEFERFTLTDSRVRARLESALLLRADVTANTAAHQRLLAHFNLYGPPAILFFTASGTRQSVRTIGYENADEFLKTLSAAGL